MSNLVRKIEKGGHDVHGLPMGAKLLHGRKSDAALARLAESEEREVVVRANIEASKEDW